MIKESYIANWRNLPADSIKVRVARPSILSPSKQLLGRWKNGDMTWEEYDEAFQNEIRASLKAMTKLFSLAEIALNKDVYLICYEKNPEHCHRKILLYWVDWIMQGVK